MNKLLVIFLVFPFFFACKKYTPPVNTFIKGYVVDTPYGNRVAGITIQASMRKRTGMSFFGPLDRGSAITKNDGTFEIAADLRPELFTNNYLSVEALPGDNHLGVSIFSNPYFSADSFQTEYSDLRFVLYKKAILTIRMRNVLQEQIQAFDIAYKYDHTGMGVYRHYNLTAPLPDTTLYYPTAAGVKTYITWSKVYSPGQIRHFTDSIVCTPGGSNIFTLSF